MKRKYILLLVAAMAAFGAYAQHEPVDLGLSVDWASCNLGASAPEQYGAYYSWGETATKSVFSWNTYRYGNSDALTKYNKSDGNRTLAPENDAASAAWGGTWPNVPNCWTNALGHGVIAAASTAISSPGQAVIPYSCRPPGSAKAARRQTSVRGAAIGAQHSTIAASS